ncbi:EAL domain-containing protein [Massilia sp. PAMC28688]|uniref:sensor domain-containing protein n=1 Tax=Massilia sp. PAMC28688 TaxID=2861283 RepID=UPI001C62A9B0|nr:bifunctional diguanylate cyclase/phosphodiesterase [Massilia sp. PAMC28688]QYF91685.1 EAL domain-containing protein [Massilia sp. PAMC28688]
MDTAEARRYEPDGPGREALDTLYRFVAALELAPTVAVHSIDRDGLVRFWNHTCEQLYGIPAREAVGQPLGALVTHLDDQQEFDATLAAIWHTRQAPQPRDWHVRRRDGGHVWMYSTHFPVMRNNEPQQIFCMEVDISQRKVEERALLEAGVNFRQLFERSNDAILLIEGNRIIDANPAALAMFHCQRLDDIAGRTLVDFSPPVQPSGESSLMADATQSSQNFLEGNRRYEWQFRLPDGAAFWAEVLLTSVTLDHQFLSYAVLHDISVRKASESTLLRAAQVFENSRDAIAITDPERRVLAINQAFTDITGYAMSEVAGAELPQLRAGGHEPAFFDQIWRFVAANGYWEGELWSARKQGEEHPLWVALTAIRNSADQVINYIAILSDITDRKRLEEHQRHLAEHDFLTDLPNRVLFLDRLQQALGVARRKKTQVAVMFIDLDRFKGINDSFGHHVGDAVLREVSGRLTRCVRGVDTVSRQGGDEFVVILADVGGADQAGHVAATVMQAVAQPVHTDGHSVSLSVSIGIAMYPTDGQDIDTLLRHADVAMYHAKQGGRNAFSFFNPDMNARVVERVQLENSLRHALANHEFELAYQPEVDIASGQTVGVEALLRWRHPQRGLLMPQHFLGVAEECGLMVPIGRWVLQEACRQARGWRDAGFPVTVAVNLSAAQFNSPDLLASVDTALAESGLTPALLELEVTEATIMGRDGQTAALVSALRARGIGVTIDDFGTGYSKLSALRHVALSRLKIDRTFIQDISGKPDDAAVITAIIAVARSLKLRVVAEGVETQAQLEFLQQLGCDIYQGHYAGEPQSAPDPARWRRQE